MAAYAGGTLGLLPAVVVATHLTACPACRSLVRLAEAVGGVLLDDLPPETLRPGAFEQAFARLDAPEQPPSPERAPDPRRLSGVGGGDAAGRPMPPHRRSVGGDQASPGPGTAQDALLWGMRHVPAPLRALPARPYRWVAPGIRFAPILRSNEGGLLGLLRVRPGVELPQHTHSGTELACVLQGAYGGKAGRFGPGDVEEADEEVEHNQVAEGPEDCICLIATPGRLRFRGLLARLWQPFMPF